MAENITQPSRHARTERGKGAAAAYHERRAAAAASAQAAREAADLRRHQRELRKRGEGQCNRCREPVRGPGQSMCQKHDNELARRRARRKRIERTREERVERARAWFAARARRAALKAGTNPAYLEFSPPD
jgi:hypothetical protein